MTEYTTSSEAIREYITARERTARWVSAHAPSGTIPAFVSPSAPPSTLSDPDAPSCGPSDSDEESSHSLPPRMVLRYNDGRPDIPIYTDPPEPLSRLGSRMNAPPAAPLDHITTHRRSKSGPHILNTPSRTSNVLSRHAQSLSYATSHHTAMPQAPITPPRSPESIVVLPSRQESEAAHSAVHTVQNPSHHSQAGPRSHSQSLSQTVPSAPVLETLSHWDEGPHVPSHQRSQHSIVAPTPRRAFDPSQIPLPVSTGSPQIAHSQSQPLPAPTGVAAAPHVAYPSSTRVQSQLPYTYAPPAIVYAPSSKHSRPHYAPPAIVYSPSATHHPQSRHAPSITYSHSAPLPQPSHHSHYEPSAYHSTHGSVYRRPSSAIPEEPVSSRHDGSYDGRSRSRAGSAARGQTPAQNVVYVDHPAPTHRQSRSPSPSEDDDDRGSRTSGSTYYVLPTPGQKVKLIVPNSASIYTATSTTKSAHSPQSAHSGQKRPFFQRIFSIPKLPGSASSGDSRGAAGPGKRLHRRHTIGGAHLQGRPGVPQR